MLPTPILANILDHLGDAGEVLRAASSCKALWAAAAGPLQKVHALIVRCARQDLSQRQLGELIRRFPNIQQISVASGSWSWTGCRSLQAWAPTITLLQANNTSFPLADALSPAHHVQFEEQQHYWSQNRPTQHSAARHNTVPQSCAGTAAASLTQRLQHLELQRCVTTPIKCRHHGSADCDCLAATVLGVLLQQNPNLQVLNLAGNTGLPDRLFRAALLSASCSSLKTLDLSNCGLLRPGELLPSRFPNLLQLCLCNTAVADSDVHHFATQLHFLRHLELTGCRKVSDVGIAALASAPALLTGQLTALGIGSLTRPTAGAVAQLMQAWAQASKVSAVPRLGNRCNTSICNTHTAAHGDAYSPCRAVVQLQLELSRTSGTSDLLLLAFMPGKNTKDDSDGDLLLTHSLLDLSLEPHSIEDLRSCITHSQHHGFSCFHSRNTAPVQFCSLQLAGCNAITCSALVHLGEAGVLSGLTSLDLSDMEAVRSIQQAQPLPQPQQQSEHRLEQSQPNDGESSASCNHAHPDLGVGSPLTDSSSSLQQAAANLTRSVLPSILQHTGGNLQKLCLDGCYMDGAAAAAFAAQGFRQLQSLSLVGCRGLSSSSLHGLLGSLPSLRQLSIGGSVSAWREPDVFVGNPVLQQLTQLKLLRRPVLRDGELAPVLAAASSLRSVWLVGCYMLSDNLFEQATCKSPDVWERQGNYAAARHTGSIPGSCNDTAEPDRLAGAAALQQLTQLCLTACDGITGHSISCLRGLQHLRASFCTSLKAAAMQHAINSCTQLRLLELPGQLSGQGSGFRVVDFNQPNNPGQPSSRSSRDRYNGSRTDWSTRGKAGQPGGSSARGAGCSEHNMPGVLVPQRSDAHAPSSHSIKITWI